MTSPATHKCLRRLPALLLPVAMAAGLASAHEGHDASYAYGTAGVVEIPNLKILLDESNLGGKEIEIAELTLAAGTVVAPHKHGSLEIFYVLSGTLGHEVNGEMHMLTPGMVGVVRIGDSVRHIVPKESDTKVLVIWAPAGEARRVFDLSQGRKIEQPK